MAVVLLLVAMAAWRPWMARALTRFAVSVWHRCWSHSNPAPSEVASSFLRQVEYVSQINVLRSTYVYWMASLRSRLWNSRAYCPHALRR